MIKSRRVVVGILILAVAGLTFGADKFGRRINVRPFAHLKIQPINTEAYFKCEKCKSLDGGLYGKGPTRQFRTTDGKKCEHVWSKTTRADFRALAALRFNVDWSRDTPFWSEDK